MDSILLQKVEEHPKYVAAINSLETFKGWWKKESQRSKSLEQELEDVNQQLTQANLDCKKLLMSNHRLTTDYTLLQEELDERVEAVNSAAAAEVERIRRSARQRGGAQQMLRTRLLEAKIDSIQHDSQRMASAAGAQRLHELEDENQLLRKELAALESMAYREDKREKEFACAAVQTDPLGPPAVSPCGIPSLLPPSFYLIPREAALSSPFLPHPVSAPPPPLLYMPRPESL